MFRAFAVEWVSALWKSFQIGRPEVVSCNVCTEKRIAGHLGELSGDSGFENVEIHCGSPV
jgi:hypothetical protein